MRKLIRLLVYLGVALVFILLLLKLSTIHENRQTPWGEFVPRKNYAHQHVHFDSRYRIPTSNSEEDIQEVVYNVAMYDRIDNLDEETIERRNKIREMMKHAWSNYKKYAWGENELKPISKIGHSSSVFGIAHLGATIVDALDTLYIMGLNKEFNEGREWIRRNLYFNKTGNDVSIFETTIRFIGGMLSCYSLTNDELFKNKAKEIADILLPAFNTETGLPYTITNPTTGISKNYNWASEGCSILSEVGTLHLEFTYLSNITGDPIYKEKVDKIRAFFRNADKPKGFYPNYINPHTGNWGISLISLGACGDSFYEYLLKSWLVDSDDADGRYMFDEAMKPIIEDMITLSPRGLTYVPDLKDNVVETEMMEHLTCFTGGMFALAAKSVNSSLSDTYMELGRNITHTCHQSYVRTPTKLGPEKFRFNNAAEARALKAEEEMYLLRPETLESYFILWRLTKERRYREWAWDIALAIEKYCRVENGYSGILNVYNKSSKKDDIQQSYFLAETLKYLYLLYSDDSLISLDDWVYNTEAHPLPKKETPFYRSAIKL